MPKRLKELMCQKIMSHTIPHGLGYAGLCAKLSSMEKIVRGASAFPSNERQEKLLCDQQQPTTAINFLFI
jgi:hypothetical protein